MGKKKHKRSTPASGLGNGRVKLPKKIGKLKLPKELRKSSERLIETGIAALRDAATREIAVAGIAAIVANATRSSPSAAQPAPRADARPEPRRVEAVIVDADPPRPAVDPDQMIDAIGTAATQLLRGLINRTRI